MSGAGAGGTLRVVADSAGGSLEALRAELLTLGRGTELPLALGPNTFRELVRLAGGVAGAFRFVGDLARDLGRPVVVNVPQAGGASKSVAIGPPDWTPERVTGYVGGLYDLLAEQFGPVTSPPGPPPPRNQRARRRR